MVISNKQEEVNVTNRNVNIEQLNSYKYLGSIINNAGKQIQIEQLNTSSKWNTLHIAEEVLIVRK